MRRGYVVAGLAVIAVLAIVSPVLGGPSLKKLVKKEVRKQLAKKTGPRGPAGARGAAGAPGAAGSPAGSVLLGRLDPTVSLATSPNITEFLSPSGLSTTKQSTAPPASMPIPANGPVVIRDLTVVLSSPPGGARIFTVMDGTTPTALTCLIFTAGTTCDTGSATATIAGGHSISLRAETGTGAVGLATVQFSMRVTSP